MTKEETNELFKLVNDHLAEAQALNDAIKSGKYSFIYRTIMKVKMEKHIQDANDIVVNIRKAHGLVT